VRKTRARSARILGAVLVLSMVVGLQAPAQANQRRSLRVMSRNLYLGASLTPIFEATTPTGALLAATQAWQQVLTTNFPARAEALADELAEEMPDLVGLQEVTLYRIGAGLDSAPATTPVLDFLAILQAEIAERGLPYAVASQVSAFDGELTILTSAAPTFADIRLTDRDVILVRTDLDPETFSVSGANSGIFAAKLPLPVANGSTLIVERGWTSVEVKYRGRSFRFIDTHLEAFHPVVQQFQSLELLAGPANTTKPVVMAGDFNSPADGSGSTSYANIVNAGFSDAWSTVHGSATGYTCCHAANVMGPSSLTTRIDIVFFRGAGFDAVEAEIVGEELTDKTAGGLWPSDHAGVLSTITYGPQPK
jgi:endonuclease/exonuclease/phosphatase family metal-dependent hydrolase